MLGNRHFRAIAALKKAAYSDAMDETLNKPRRGRDTGCLRQKREGGNWYIGYWVDTDRGAKQVWESAGSPIKAKAEALLRKRLAARDKGEVQPQGAQKLKYDDIRKLWLDDMMNRGSRSVRLNADGEPAMIFGLGALDGFFLGMNCTRITTECVQRYRASRRNVSPATADKELSLLRAMVSLAKKRGKFTGEIDYQMTGVDNKRQGFVTPADFERLLKEIPPRMHSLLVFLYETGTRIGEARSVRWQHVDLKAGEIVLWVTKNGEARRAPISKRLALLLGKPGDAHTPVFHQGSFRKVWAKAAQACKLGEWVLEDGKKAQWVGINVHDFRRSAAVNMARAGVPQDLSMSITGHKTASMWRRYAIVDAQAQRKAMDAVSALLDATSMPTPTLEGDVKT